MKEEINRGLESSYNNAIALMDSLNEKQLDEKVKNKPGGWSAIEIFRHLANSERGLTIQMKNIVAGKGGVPDDFDLNRYNDALTIKMQELSTAEIKKIWDENRKDLINFLNILNPDDFDKSGRHPMGQILTIYQYFEIIVGHILEHTEEIELALL